jgi:5-(carboxyamino)imidazole ribonucleotide mutase
MPPGIPVATVGLDAAQNAALLAVQIIGTGDPAIMEKMAQYKAGLGKKIIKANEDLARLSFRFRVISRMRAA